MSAMSFKQNRQNNVFLRAPLCRHYSRNGKCWEGAQCKYLHENVPTKGDPTGKLAAEEIASNNKEIKKTLGFDVRASPAVIAQAEEKAAKEEKLRKTNAMREARGLPPLPPPEPELLPGMPGFGISASAKPLGTPKPKAIEAPKAQPENPGNGQLVNKEDPGGGVLVVSGGRAVGDTRSSACYVSDLPKNFHGGEEALHFALGELFGQFGKIKKIELYMDEGMHETQDFKGEALVVYHPSKHTGTRDKGDPVYDACNEMDGRWRKLGYRMWRIHSAAALWQKEGYDVKTRAKKHPCVLLGNLWEYSGDMSMGWFTQIQDVIRDHAAAHIEAPFVKVDPMEGTATVWCKGAKDAMKFAAIMQKSFFLGRKITSTLCRTEKPKSANLTKVDATPTQAFELQQNMSPEQLAALNAAAVGAEGGLTMKTLAQQAVDRGEGLAPPAKPTILKEGSIVRITGLSSKPENNGLKAEVLAYFADVKKYQLKMEESGKTVRVKPENLELDQRDQVPSASAAAEALSERTHGSEAVSAAPGGAHVAAEAFALAEGSIVKLKGLVAKPEHNGMEAEVIEYLRDVQKYHLRMFCGKTIRVKPENVELCEDESQKDIDMAYASSAAAFAEESDGEDEAAEDEAQMAAEAAAAAANMAAGNVLHGAPLKHDPRTDGFLAAVCVDPALLPKKEVEAEREKKRESSRSRERRVKEREEAIKARAAAAAKESGARPSWVVPSPQELFAASAAGQLGAGAGFGASLPKEPPESREELSKMSVGKLKDLLKEYGKSSRGCLEKRDFVDRLKPSAKA